jgi:2-amino-4-hydroxy-6-hydroxymethyldihydropteridine diphosphokinase
MPQPRACHKTETLGLISLGSNVAEQSCQPLDRLRQALLDFADHEIVIRAASQFYQTPFSPANQGADFVNAVAIVSATFSAEQVLERLHRIEKAHNRTRTSRWADRTLDLDLLAWGEDVAPSRAIYQKWRDLPPESQREQTPNELILPHPRLQDRAFVLVPLAEIWTTWRHPVSNDSVADMLAALPENDKSTVIPLGN